jgi:hypothetical protein
VDRAVRALGVQRIAIVEISIVIRLLGPFKFVDHPKNSIVPLSNEFGVLNH